VHKTKDLKMIAQRKFLFFFIFITSLVLVILGSSFVLGLGVSPSRVTMRYVPNANYVYEGQACYATNAYGHLELSQGGEFQENLKFTNAEDNQFYPIEQGCLTYTYRMPNIIERPGTHRTVIYATEVPDESSGMINAVVRIEQQIDIFVPYPGKYLEVIEFLAKNNDAGADIPFKASVINRGNETVEQAQGTISVYDYQMNLIDTIKTNNAKKIVPDETRDLTATWDSGDYKQGNYHALIKITYDDGLEVNSTTDFKLGGLDVNLMDYSKEIIIGGIRPFEAVADSIWSETVRNVRAYVEVLNSSGIVLASFETLTRDIPAWGTATLRGYLDTTSLKLGVYDLKINLSFENLSKTYYKNLSIIKEPEPEKPKKDLWKTLGAIFTAKVMLIIFGVLLLITMTILVYVLLPRKKKVKEQKQKI
jgi:hypothetical protein